MTKNTEVKRRDVERSRRRERAGAGALHIEEALSLKRTIGDGGTHSVLVDADVSLIHDTGSLFTK